MLNIEQERDAFNSWFYASKYAQIVPPTKAHEQAAWDGWQAGRAALAAQQVPRWLSDDEIAEICAECSLATPSDIYFAQQILRAAGVKEPGHE